MRWLRDLIKRGIGSLGFAELKSFMEGRFDSLHHQLGQLKEVIMALHSDVQALLDAVAAQGQAITDAAAEIGVLESHAATLEQQVTDLQNQINNGSMIDAIDLAAIQQATSMISASVQTLKNAMPQPVAQATVQAAADAASAPAPAPSSGASGPAPGAV